MSLEVASTVDWCISWKLILSRPLNECKNNSAQEGLNSYPGATEDIWYNYSYWLSICRHRSELLNGEILDGRTIQIFPSLPPSLPIAFLELPTHFIRTHAYTYMYAFLNVSCPLACFAILFHMPHKSHLWKNLITQPRPKAGQVLKCSSVCFFAVFFCSALQIDTLETLIGSRVVCQSRACDVQGKLPQ